jgi:hypothetical protein
VRKTHFTHYPSTSRRTCFNPTQSQPGDIFLGYIINGVETTVSSCKQSNRCTVMFDLQFSVTPFNYYTILSTHCGRQTSGRLYFSSLVAVSQADRRVALLQHQHVIRTLHEPIFYRSCLHVEALMLRRPALECGKRLGVMQQYHQYKRKNCMCIAS